MRRVFIASFAVLFALAAPAIPLAAEDAEPTQPEATPQTAAPEEPSTGLGGVVKKLLRPGPAPAAPAAAPPAAPEPPAPVPAAAPEPVVASASKKAEPKPVARKSAAGSVTIKDFEFAPATVKVEVGDTVTWINHGPTPHSATADGGFDTGILPKGGRGSHKFTEAGTFSYICTPHPNMKGTVVVSAAGGSSGSGSGDTGSSESADDSGEDASTTAKDELADTGFEALLVAFLGATAITGGYALRVRLRDRHKAETNG